MTINSKQFLEVRQPSAMGGRFVENFRDKATNYRRTIRLVGGFWQAQWDFSGETYDADYGRHWFYNRLGFDMREMIGGFTTWRGMVDEIDLYEGGMAMRRSLMPVINAVRAIYTDGVGNLYEVAAWEEDDLSIAKYGRRELILVMDKVFLAQVEEEMANTLAEYADPKPVFHSVADSSEDKCVVRASGYVYSTNFQYITIGDGETQVDTSTYITNLITTDCDLLSTGNIAANTEDIIHGQDRPTKVWDELVRALGVRADEETPPHTINVTNENELDYFQIDVNPKYYWINRSLQAHIGGRSGINPWMVTPGVVRDPAWGALSAPASSYLQQGNDVLLEEVSMSDDAEQPGMTSTRFEDAQLASLMGQGSSKNPLSGLSVTDPAIWKYAHFFAGPNTPQRFIDWLMSPAMQRAGAPSVMPWFGSPYRNSNWYNENYWRDRRRGGY